MANVMFAQVIPQQRQTNYRQWQLSYVLPLVPEERRQEVAKYSEGTLASMLAARTIFIDEHESMCGCCGERKGVKLKNGRCPKCATQWRHSATIGRATAEKAISEAFDAMLPAWDGYLGHATADMKSRKFTFLPHKR